MPQLSPEIVAHVQAALAAPDGVAHARAARIINENATPDDAWAIEPLRAHLLAALAPDSTIGLLDLRAVIVPITSALGLVGDASAVASLVAALAHPDERLVAAAAVALGEIGDHAAIDPLIAALERRPAPGIAQALGMLRAVEAQDALLAALQTSMDRPPVDELDEGDDTEDLFVALSDALGRVGAAPARALLATLLEHPADTVRLHAAIALSRIGDNRALPQIVAVATDPLGGYRSPRWAAAKRLAELDDPRGLEAMRDIYQRRDRIYQRRDTDIPARHAMIRDLGRHGDAGDIALLEWVAQHDDAPTDQGWTLAQAAARAIARISALHRER